MVAPCWEDHLLSADTLPTEAAICSKNFPLGDEGSPVRPLRPSTDWSSLQPQQMSMISSSLSSEMRMWELSVFITSAISCLHAVLPHCFNPLFTLEWASLRIQFKITTVMKIIVSGFISPTWNSEKRYVCVVRVATKTKQQQYLLLKIQYVSTEARYVRVINWSSC